MHFSTDLTIQSSYRVRLLLSYDGSAYCGWQSQLIHKNKNSIQNILEGALTKIYKQPIACVAAGRTDSGAHAVGQNVHFDVKRNPREIPLLLALRTLLPPSISVRKAWVVPLSFSSISSACAKTYRYYILNADCPSALRWRLTYWHPHHLNLEMLNSYAKQIVGSHDFKSFQSSSGRPPKSSVRRIYQARWYNPKPNLFIFEITGNGFLTQMVRNLVSCQLGLHKKNGRPDDFLQIVNSQDRRKIGRPAPASGLFLTRVYYRKSLLSRIDPMPFRK
jgi:tRNA pseudouridine38-40 synthase